MCQYDLDNNELQGLQNKGSLASTPLSGFSTHTFLKVISKQSAEYYSVYETYAIKGGNPITSNVTQGPNSIENKIG